MALKVAVSGAERTFSVKNITTEVAQGDRFHAVRMDATFRAGSTEDVARSGKLNVADYCQGAVVSIDKVVGLEFADDDGREVTLTGDALRAAVLGVFECAAALRGAHVDALTKGVSRKN